MFNAELISLCDGQSYKNVVICEKSDIITNNIPPLFEEWTICFFVDDRRIICHAWNVKLIHLDRTQRGGPGSIPVDRVILSGNTSYAPALVLSKAAWMDHGIKGVFGSNYNFEGQFVFSCHQGTIITCDTTVTSVITSAPKKQGVTNSKLVTTKLNIDKFSKAKAKIWKNKN